MDDKWLVTWYQSFYLLLGRCRRTEVWLTSHLNAWQVDVQLFCLPFFSLGQSNPSVNRSRQQVPSSTKERPTRLPRTTFQLLWSSRWFKWDVIVQVFHLMLSIIFGIWQHTSPSFLWGLAMVGFPHSRVAQRASEYYSSVMVNKKLWILGACALLFLQSVRQLMAGQRLQELLKYWKLCLYCRYHREFRAWVTCSALWHEIPSKTPTRALTIESLSWVRVT